MIHAVILFDWTDRQHQWSGTTTGIGPVKFIHFFGDINNADYDGLFAPTSQPGGVLVPPSSTVVPACVTATAE
jgi:hypothetical protein